MQIFNQLCFNKMVFSTILCILKSKLLFKKIRILRAYGLGLVSKEIYDQIIEWLEKHNGEMPPNDEKMKIIQQRINQKVQEQNRQMLWGRR